MSHFLVAVEDSANALHDWSLYRTDPYSSSCKLGSGSFGTVILAQNTNVGVKRSYAIKVFHSKTLPYDKILDRARAEANIVQDIQNKLQCKDNVVSVIGLVAGPICASSTIRTLLTNILKEDIHDNLVGIVMNYEKGGSLEELLYPPEGTPKTPLSLKDKFKILTDVISGLYEIHILGYTHGDIKPGNILFSRKGDPSSDFKLTDFGLSRQNRDIIGLSLDSETETAQGGSLTGTYIYMAPELLQKVQPSRRSDLYAFGMLAWEVLAEMRPFSHITSQAELGFTLGRGERPDPKHLPEGMQKPSYPIAYVNIIT